MKLWLSTSWEPFSIFLRELASYYSNLEILQERNEMETWVVRKTSSWLNL